VFSVSLWLTEFAAKLTTETQRTQRLHREEVRATAEVEEARNDLRGRSEFTRRGIEPWPPATAAHM